MWLPAAAMPRLSRLDRRTVTWTVLLLALGLVLALPWTVRERAQPRTREVERESALQSITRLEAEQRDLKERIAALRARIAETQQRQLTARAAFGDVEAALTAQRALAGLTPLTGPGLTVTLADSAATAPPGSAAADYIVHDTDLRDIVNALWAAGAEAVAVNGERLVASSSIVCVGTVIIINDTRLSPPYAVTAIGEPARLGEALDTSPQLQALRRRVRELGLLVKPLASRSVTVPAFTGSFPRGQDNGG